MLALWCTCIRNKKWNNDECKIFLQKKKIRWFFMLFLFLHHNVNFFNYEIKNKLTNVRCFCKIIYWWKLFLITLNKFYFFNCQLQWTHMWPMLPKHNRIQWRRPPAFHLQAFIPWQHIYKQGGLQINRHMETVFPMHHQTMRRWRSHHPHTFVTQFKNRPYRQLMTKSFTNNV